MLSPVSPSATGNTLRSLISSRRDSRCASAPATRARKRIRLGSGTTRGWLERLGDLAGFEAARANVDAARSALGVDDADLLEVRVEAPAGRDHRVAAVVAERRALVA